MKRIMKPEDQLKGEGKGGRWLRGVTLIPGCVVPLSFHFCQSQAGHVVTLPAGPGNTTRLAGDLPLLGKAGLGVKVRLFSPCLLACYVIVSF